MMLRMWQYQSERRIINYISDAEALLTTPNSDSIHSTRPNVNVSDN